jgi:hypothetical protein
MSNLASAAPLVKNFSDPGNAIREVAVKAEAEQQAEAILGV